LLLRIALFACLLSLLFVRTGFLAQHCCSVALLLLLLLSKAAQAHTERVPSPQSAKAENQLKQSAGAMWVL